MEDQPTSDLPIKHNVDADDELEKDTPEEDDEEIEDEDDEDEDDEE